MGNLGIETRHGRLQDHRRELLLLRRVPVIMDSMTEITLLRPEETKSPGRIIRFGGRRALGWGCKRL